MQIGDVVTDKNGAQVVIHPETNDCHGCFYIGTGCYPVRNQDLLIGCADGKFIFKRQEKK